MNYQCTNCSRYASTRMPLPTNISTDVRCKICKSSMVPTTATPVRIAHDHPARTIK